MGKLDFSRKQYGQRQKIDSKLFLISSIIVIIIILLAILWLNMPEVYAVQSGSSHIVIETGSGRVLSSYNKDMRLEMASTTKIATAIVALENSSPDDVVEITKEMTGIEGSSLYLKEGERWKLIDLIYGLMLQSGNDAATAIAIRVGGSTEGFVDMMNAKAKELGCLNTHFVNPNGVHDDNHYSTAYDMALIGRYAMKFDDITRISMVTQYTLPKTNKYDKEDRVFNTTNGLVTKNDEYYYPEAIGLKTGYTDKSGYCIVTSAKKGDVELLEVVMGSDTIDDRYSDCIKLFDYGFENYSYQNLVSSSELIDTIEVDGATKETKSLDIVAKSDIDILLKNNIDVNGIEPSIEINIFNFIFIGDNFKKNK